MNDERASNGVSVDEFNGFQSYHPLFQFIFLDTFLHTISYETTELKIIFYNYFKQSKEKKRKTNKKLMFAFYFLLSMNQSD